MRRIFVLSLCLLLIVPGACARTVDWQPNLETGAVVAAHPLAVEAGWNILAGGGNAIDAAIAVSFVLNVVEPFASGIGGGGFMLIFPSQGEPVFIDYRETAPFASTPDMFIDNPPSAGTSVAVPGQLRGMEKALEEFGTMPMAELMVPAIELAADGFYVSPLFTQISLQQISKLLNNDNMSDTFLFEGFMPLEQGDLLIQKDLSQTLQLLADEGFDIFYTGVLAGEIVETVKNSGGLMTLDDLASYSVRSQKPMEGSFEEFTILTAPPPSAGGLSLLQMLSTWEVLTAETGQLLGSPDGVANLSLVMGLAFLDQDRYMGDPDFVEMPLDMLSSYDYAQTMAESILSGEAGVEFDLQPVGPNTTSFVVADSLGNVVVVTQTINHFFGSGLMVPGRGIVLNNQMADFSHDPSSPNAPTPGARPVSNMTPTILLKDGKPVLALGSPGARRISSSLAQVIIYHLQEGYGLEDALALPRFHYEGLQLHIEDGFSEDVYELLSQAGFSLNLHQAMDSYFGGVTLISWQGETPQAAYDYRRDGHAILR